MPREEAGPTVGRRVEITSPVTQGATSQASAARGGDRIPARLEASHEGDGGRGRVRGRVGDGGTGQVGLSGFLSSVFPPALLRLFRGDGEKEIRVPYHDSDAVEDRIWLSVKARHSPPGCT